MPSFTVTAAGQKVQLDGSGAAQAQYTVTNTSPDELTGRLLATPQDPAKPEWFSIVGEATRDFAPGAAEQTVVQIKVPPGTPPATYSVRLDAVSEANPDEDFTEGPSVSFDVSLPAPPEPWWKKWWWVFVIAGVVLLIVIGVAVWLLTNDSSSTPVTTAATTTVATSPIPDVKGLAETAAEVAITDKGFAVQVRRVFAISTDAGLVVGQDPPAGTLEPAGTVVTINVGTEFHILTTVGPIITAVQP